MQNAMKILGVLLALALLYAVWVGLGLGKTFKRSKFMVPTQLINDFEYERDDFDWATGGYVKIEPSKENKIHGKLCAKVTFFPTAQFYPTPVPGIPPTNSSQVFYSQEGKSSWRPQISLDTTSVTRLEVFEWQEFEEFKMDVYNEQDYPVTYHLQVADAQSFVHEATGELGPRKVTNIEVPLLDLVDKRMDLTSIRSFRFWLEMSEASRPAVVYLDYLRLEGEMAKAKRRPTPVPEAVPATSPAPLL
jgi:hypothetical protein